MNNYQRVALPLLALCGLLTTHANASSLPPGFVYLSDIDASIVQELRYAGDHNFIGRPIKGYHAPECILTGEAAQALHKIQEQLQPLLSLKVYDCYRPQQAVADFMAWSKQPTLQTMKREFYPQTDKEKLFDEGYIAVKSGHSRGSTVDLTLILMPPSPQATYHKGQKLVSCVAPLHRRFADNSIDMGTGFDCLDPLSSISRKDIGQPAYQNRQFLARVMTKNGFVPYAKEWWHFTLEQEPYKDTYFDFPIQAKAKPHTS